MPERLACFRLYGESITGSDRMAEAMARDLARIKAKALGRPPVASDRLARSLHLLLRRLSDPAAAIEGLRARIAGHPMD